MRKNIKMIKGSEWRKWNFHVHTKGTNKNDQFTSVTMDDFFYKFFKKAFDNKVEAIGVTDYFSADKFKEAIKYINDIESKLDNEGANLFNDEEIEFIKSIFIFPNVELRITPTTKKGKFINLHFLFNPNIIDQLDNEFFNKLSNVEKYLMNKEHIKQYAKSLDDSLNDDQLYKYGIDNYNIEFGNIKHLLETNKFICENSIIAISSKSNDGVSGLKDYYEEFEQEGGSLLGTIKSIYKLSRIIFSHAPSDINYFLGKKTSIDEVISHTGSLKPCIIGCDSHKEETLFTKFTWVKADLNFEGLRQICFEPEQRVKIQDSKPDFKEDKVIIDKVKFISDNNTFNNQEIHLNQNLNVIIGGKSSGKSILLYSIAKTLLPDQEILKNETGKEKYNLKEIDSNFNFEITTKAGINQMLFRNNEENSIIPDIKYIPQNYLVKLAETEINNKGRSLNKLVRDLINEDSNSKAIYDNFIKQVQQLDKVRDNKINHYFSLLDDLKKCEDDSKTKSNKEVLETNIATNLAKVEELNKQAGLTPEQLEKYKELQQQEIINKANLEAFRQDFDKTNIFLNELEIKLKDIKILKSNYLSSLTNANISAFYSDKITSIDKMIEEVELCKEEIKISVTEEKKKFFIKENVLKSELSLIITERDRINQELVLFKQTDELKKQIDSLNQSIQNDQKLLKEIEELSKVLIEIKDKIELCKSELFQLYDEVYNEYQLLIEALKERTNELEKDGLEIEGIPQFNFKKFYNKIIDLSDGRRASYKDYDIILDEDKKSITEYSYDDVKNELEKVFDAVMDDSYSIISKTNKKDFIKVLLYDYFFDYWKITYKNDKLGEMSTGKASFVILMLIIGLSKSKSPILIDQPEDNLDNRSITRDLVDYLKNKKLERQIIVVTHNANIVVNADAENIIVANQKGQNNIESTSPYKFDYINGAIENTKAIDPSETDLLKSMGIREHIAEIVEGGKDAFMLREKKYRFIREI